MRALSLTGQARPGPGCWNAARSLTTTLLLLAAWTNAVRAEGFTPSTRLGLVEGRWQINGQVTYRGAPAEGLLMNVRMVNAVFEDRNRPGFDPEANTERFLKQLPNYVAHGVRAFTINLQGGMPGYEGALCSAFEPDGALRPSYMSRVTQVIEASDRAGAAIILGCFYQRQDQVLRDEPAVRAALTNVVRWVRDQGYTNVVIEVVNEYPHRGFDHRILNTPEGQAELIRLAKRTAPGLLVSTSGLGNGRLHPPVIEASDFLLIHFNGTPLEEIPGRIKALKPHGKAIVCNEDDRAGDDFARAAEICVAQGISYGLMLNDLNQYDPFTFNGAADHPAFYAALKRLTTPR